MQEDNKALAPVQPAAQAIAPNSQAAALAILGGDEAPMYCSFDLATPEGKALLFRAAQAPAENVAAMHKQVIDLVHVYASYAEKADPKTGELIPLTRIVLVNDKGELFQCYSKGVKKAIRLLAAAYGLPPYKPPIRVVVDSGRLGNGNNWLTLQPADDAGPKGKAK